MEFNINHPILFLLAGIMVAVVLGQYVYFLLKALKRSKELGMDQAKIKKTITTAAIFPVAPAVSIVLSVIALGKIDALTAQQYVNITLVMTISIMVGIWLVPVISKKLLGGMSNLETKDKKWAEIFQNAMFIGMIAAFLGFVFCDFGMLWNPVEGIAPTTGLIPVCVMGVSAVIMVILGLAMRKWKWLGDYALPISLILGMASAIPITAWLG